LKNIIIIINLRKLYIKFIIKNRYFIRIKKILHKKLYIIIQKTILPQKKLSLFENNRIIG
jgi:hypothetical protein